MNAEDTAASIWMVLLLACGLIAVAGWLGRNRAASRNVRRVAGGRAPLYNRHATAILLILVLGVIMMISLAAE